MEFINRNEITQDQLEKLIQKGEVKLLQKEDVLDFKKSLDVNILNPYDLKGDIQRREQEFLSTIKSLTVIRKGNFGGPVKESVNVITLSQNEIEKGYKPPKGWSEVKYKNKEEANKYSPDESGKVVHHFSAPMEGWDHDHTDDVHVIKHKDGNHSVHENYAFSGEPEGGPKKFPNYKKAIKYAHKAMKETNKFNKMDPD